MCKKIHRGGNAEQYHANKKFKEAVAVAVAACADDTRNRTTPSYCMRSDGDIGRIAQVRQTGLWLKTILKFQRR